MLKACGARTKAHTQEKPQSRQPTADSQPRRPLHVRSGEVHAGRRPIANLLRGRQVAARAFRRSPRRQAAHREPAPRSPSRSTPVPTKSLPFKGPIANQLRGRQVAPRAFRRSPRRQAAHRDSAPRSPRRCTSRGENALEACRAVGRNETLARKPNNVKYCSKTLHTRIHRDRPGRVSDCRRSVSISPLFRWARCLLDSAVVGTARVPPQIRTCGTTASGSSGVGLARGSRAGLVFAPAGAGSDPAAVQMPLLSAGRAVLDVLASATTGA